MKCDNAAVVHILLNRSYSKDPEVMHLMRCLHFITARFNFRVTAEHIQGSLNTAADALLCNSFHSFKVLIPTANQSPTHPKDPCRPFDGEQTGLAIHQLDSSVQFYLDQSLAPSTKRSYSTGQHRYHNFCSLYHVSPYPIKEDIILCKYAAYPSRSRFTSSNYSITTYPLSDTNRYH